MLNPRRGLFQGVSGYGFHIWKSVYLRFVLNVTELRNFIPVRNIATIDAHRVCILCYRYGSPYCIRATCGADTLGVLYSISRISAWVSKRCLFSGKGNAKTWLRGTSSGYRLPRFFCIRIANHFLLIMSIWELLTK